LALSPTLPFFFSFLACLPLALITSCTVPAAPTILLITAPAAEAPLTPLPPRTSEPGFGTSTLRIAVPLRLLRFSLPNPNELLGSNTAEMLMRLFESTPKSPTPPSARLSILMMCESEARPGNRQAFVTELPSLSLIPIRSPGCAGTLAPKVLSADGVRVRGPSWPAT
jgi:hypothetical protein